MITDSAKKMRCFRPIRVLLNQPNRDNHRMVTIGRIPHLLVQFLSPTAWVFSNLVHPRSLSH